MRRLAVVLGALALAVVLRPAPPAVGPVQDAPPAVSAAATALGGFNGLAASYVWLYASRQADQGRPFELLRAARWMAALQPNLGSLYDFQAWNLAYNVADSFGDGEERWRWVLAGLRLLYQDGLTRRGDDPRVPHALATLLLGRVCGGLGGADELFRQRFAGLAAPTFGAPPVDWGRVDEAALSRNWHLRPADGAGLDREFGPFDWRTGWPHALYWARRATVVEPSRRLARPLWATQLEALRGAFQDGRIVSAAGEPVFITVPQPELASAVEHLYDEAERAVTEQGSFALSRRNWQAESALVLVAFGRSSDERAADAAASELVQGDVATALALATSYRLRALLCRALGEDRVATGLEAMARRLARAGGAEWSTVEANARQSLGQQGLSPQALARAGR